jgi:hypothetical protein
MSFSTKSVYRLVSAAAQIGVKQFTLCLKGAHCSTGEPSYSPHGLSSVATAANRTIAAAAAGSSSTTNGLRSRRQTSCV